VAVLPIDPDGRLAPASARVQHEGSSVHRRQRAPHAHWIDVDPSGRFALVADLGLDEILSYRLDAGGRLTPYPEGTARLAPGAGPRHLAFHPDGRRAYVIDEIDSTITVLAYDPAAGRFETLQRVSTLPEDYQGSSTTAEIALDPSGRFAYGSNRGHDSIAIFAIDIETGRLTPAGHQPSGGRTPRSFAIDPSGRFLLAANQGSDNVAVFRISREDGALAPIGEPLRVPRPVCILFAPHGE
jgi:6-phosphogluconolactonase